MDTREEKEERYTGDGRMDTREEKEKRYKEGWILERRRRKGIRKDGY